MLFVAVALAVVLVVPPLAGSYTNLASLRLRHVWLVAIAIGAQMVIFTVVEIEAGAVGSTVHLASYALLGAFVVANRHVRWLWVMALGWAANTAAIVANGGVMPISPSVARTLGLEAGDDRFVNAAPLDDARLAVLGDVFVSPGWAPLQNSFSIGDVLLVMGLGLVVAAASRTPAGADDDGGRDVSTATAGHDPRAVDPDPG